MDHTTGAQPSVGPIWIQLQYQLEGRDELMISSIRIERFRSFNVLRLENLGRVNLIMGANNCGKTTALEAINLLTSQGSTEALVQTIWRRDGTVLPFRRVNQSNYKGSVWPLFYGNDCEADATFELSSSGSNSEACLTGRISDRLQDGSDNLQWSDYGDSGMAFCLEGVPEPCVTEIPIDNSGEITKRALNRTAQRQPNYLQDNPNNVLLRPVELDACDLVSMWNDIVLTPDKERILRILASLDDGIDHITTQFSGETQQDTSPGCGQFVVKYKGISSLLPIESFGSGLWRLFSLALVINYCRNGTLLVDEINTGLDSTSQAIVWRMMLSLVHDLNVQVFATTHDIDCINRLAKEALDPSINSEVVPNVVFSRIESGREEPIQLTPNQILIAAKHCLEIR